MDRAEPEAEDIFCDALELTSTAERAAYLDRACGDNADLRRRVQRLLDAHAQADGFLAAGPSVTAAATEPAAEAPGTVIGPYKLLEQLGEGGFGVVYLAEQQQPVRRKVALKVLKPGMDTRQVIARFEAERQALAIMDHPHIAKVFDGGATPSGRPYFVMEWVKGVPITEYCDQNQLTPRQRLELFLPVCRAVQHAHTKGIIHRDLKPSNVLVSRHDTTPVVKVIDFGVAKALGQALTDKTLYTGIAQMIGTPLYMSPEQAGRSDLDVDTRSDIYSLGVLLYELLTGTTPFDRDRLREAGYEELRRILREEEPPRPSARVSTLGQAANTVSERRKSEPGKLSQLFRGELDWVVMKCMEKDRDRRYETASALALDLRRYLHDEPVQACPPSAVYQLRKFVRRNKGPVLAALAIVFLLTGGIVGTALGLVKATAEATQKEQARKTAEETYRKARQALNEYFTLVSENKLLDVPGLEPLRADLLKAALRYYQPVLDQRGEDPDVLADLAATYLRVATIHHELDRNDESMAAAASGLQLARRLRRDYPHAIENHRQLAGYFKFGRRLHKTRMPKDPAAARRTLTGLLELWEVFARDNPDVEGFQNDLASLYDILGLLEGGRGLAGERGALARSVTYYRRAITIWEELGRAHPSVATYRENLVRAYGHLEWQLTRNGNKDQAREAAGQAARILEQLLVQFPAVPAYRSLHAMRLLDGAQALAGNRPQEAEKVYREAVQAFQKLITDFPAASDYRKGLSIVHTKLAELLAGPLKRPEDALHAYRQGVEQAELAVTYSPRSPTLRSHLGWTYRGLAEMLARAPKPTVEWEEVCQRDLSVFDRLAADAPDEPDWPAQIAHAHRSRAFALLRLGRYRDAVSAHREAIRVLEKSSARFPAVTSHRGLLADTCNTAAWLLVTAPEAQARNPTAAVELAQRAVELRPEEGTYWKSLGLAGYRAEKWVDAIAGFEKSLQFGKANGFDRFFLAMAHWKHGNKDEARWRYREAVKWLEKTEPTNKDLARIRAEAAELMGLDKKD